MLWLPGDGETGDVGVEGDGHKVQRPRGAEDAKSEEKRWIMFSEGNGLLGKKYCEIYLQQFTI